MKIYEIISERLPPASDPLGKVTSKKRSIANDVATLMGKNSKTWNPNSNKIAQQMSDAGKTPEEIWAATQNWKFNGTWKQEIDDSGARFKNGGNTSLGSQLDHKKLLKAYPAMADYDYDKNVDTSNYSGQFRAMHTKPNDKTNPSGKSGMINISKYAHDKMNVTGHEIQHGVGDREDWPIGGSPKSQRTKNLAKELGVTPHEAYRMYSDEILARITADRWNMTPAERKLNMPQGGSTTDIISSTDGGVVNKIIPNTHSNNKFKKSNTDIKPNKPRKSWMKPGHNYDASTGGSIFDSIKQ